VLVTAAVCGCLRPCCDSAFRGRLVSALSVRGHLWETMPCGASRAPHRVLQL